MAQPLVIQSVKKYLFTLILLIVGVSSQAATTYERSVVYGVRNSIPLTLDVVKPTKPNGAAILMIQSGGWMSKYRDAAQIVAPNNGMVTAGYTVFIIWHSNPPYSTIPEASADVLRAVRYIRAYAPRWKVDANRMGVFGSSSAGHLSLMVATGGDDGNFSSRDVIDWFSSRVKTAIVINAPSDLRGWTTNPPPAIAAAPVMDAPLNFSPSLEPSVSPITLLDRQDSPMLLIHGSADEIVPVQQSYNMFSATQATGIYSELKIIPGGTHYLDVYDLLEALIHLSNWLNVHLPTVP